MARATKQQQAVWEALRAAAGPLLPEEILELAQRACPSLGQATVYRALKRLESEGRVLRIADLDGRARFEIEGTHHDHFHCRQCDKVFDVPGCVARPAAEIRRRLPRGFRLEGHELWLHGVCAVCRG